VLAGLFGALAKIPGVGPLIQGVAAAFGSLHDYAHGVAVSFDEAGLSATGATNAMSSGADAATQSIYGTGNAVQALNQKMSDLLGQALSVKQAELGMAQALTGVADSAQAAGHVAGLRDREGPGERLRAACRRPSGRPAPSGAARRWRVRRLRQRGLQPRR
jgi:hypothetical protein